MRGFGGLIKFQGLELPATHELCPPDEVRSPVLQTVIVPSKAITTKSFLISLSLWGPSGELFLAGTANVASPGDVPTALPTDDEALFFSMVSVSGLGIIGRENVSCHAVLAAVQVLSWKWAHTSPE